MLLPIVIRPTRLAVDAVLCASQLDSGDLISLHFISSIKKRILVRFHAINDGKHVYNSWNAFLSKPWRFKTAILFFSFEAVPLQLIDVLIVFPGKHQGYIGSLERSD